MYRNSPSSFAERRMEIRICLSNPCHGSLLQSVDVHPHRRVDERSLNSLGRHAGPRPSQLHDSSSASITIFRTRPAYDPHRPVSSTLRLLPPSVGHHSSASRVARSLFEPAALSSPRNSTSHHTSLIPKIIVQRSCSCYSSSVSQIVHSYILFI